MSDFRSMLAHENNFCPLNPELKIDKLSVVGTVSEDKKEDKKVNCV